MAEDLHTLGWSWEIDPSGWFYEPYAFPLKSYREVIETPAEPPNYEARRKYIIYPVGKNESGNLDTIDYSKPFDETTWLMLSEYILKFAQVGLNYEIPEAKTFMDAQTLSSWVRGKPWSLDAPDSIRAIHALLYAACPERLAPYFEVPPTMWEKLWVERVVAILKNGWCRRIIKEWVLPLHYHVTVSGNFIAREGRPLYGPNITLYSCNFRVNVPLGLLPLTITFPGCPDGTETVNSGVNCAMAYSGQLTFTYIPNPDPLFVARQIWVSGSITGPNGTVNLPMKLYSSSGATPSFTCKYAGTIYPATSGANLNGWGEGPYMFADAETGDIELPVRYEYVG